MKAAVRIVLLAGLVWACAAALAQSYPTRPVRLLIPFVPGGSTDFVARVMQTRLTEELGQPIVIDNRPGASGNIAVEIAGTAPADGHTVLFGNVGTIAINPALLKELRVIPTRDLACVSVVADVSALLVVNASVPASNFEEFVRYAKSRPAQLNFASTGAGSNGRLTWEYIMSRTGLDVGHVAYKGASAAVTALLSNETQIGISATPTTIPYLKSGRLRALALLGPARTASLPEVPTLPEIGFPELKVSSWQGLYVPARTPAATVARLRKAVVRAIHDPKALEALKVGGAGPMDPALLEDCNAFSREQAQFWGELVRKTGLAGRQ